MVIGDDDRPSVSSRIGDRIDRGGPTIAGENEARIGLPRRGEAGGTEVVAVPQPVRNERNHIRTRLPQDTGEHRGRTLTVDVVVAVHEYALTAPDRLDDQRDCFREPVENGGICQGVEAGSQEALGPLRVGEAALDQ